MEILFLIIKIVSTLVIVISAIGDMLKATPEELITGRKNVGLDLLSALCYVFVLVAIWI